MLRRSPAGQRRVHARGGRRVHQGTSHTHIISLRLTNFLLCRLVRSTVSSCSAARSVSSATTSTRSVCARRCTATPRTTSSSTWQTCRSRACWARWHKRLCKSSVVVGAPVLSRTVCRTLLPLVVCCYRSSCRIIITNCISTLLYIIEFPMKLPPFSCLPHVAF